MRAKFAPLFGAIVLLCATFVWAAAAPFSGDSSSNNTTDLSLGTANGLTLTGQTLSFGTADAGVAGKFTVNQDLTIVGDAGISGSETVVGQFTAANDAGVLNSLRVGGTLNVTGSSAFTGSIVVSGDTSGADVYLNTINKGGAAGAINYSASVANGASATSHIFNTSTTLSTAGAHLTDFKNNGTIKASSDLNGFYLQPIQSSAPSGSFTLTATSNYIEVTCSAGGGCAATLSETGAQPGTIIQVVNMGTNTVSFADSNGVQEIGTLLGTVSLGQYDAVTWIYATDRWVAISK